MNFTTSAIIKCYRIGLVLIAAVLGASAAPVCVTGTLASYIALDKTGGCTIGDFTFIRFKAPATSVSGNPPVADSSQILVTPMLTTGGVGFGFSAEASETNLFSIPNPTQSDSVTYHINYTLDPPGEGGQSLQMDPPFGDVTVTQRYCLFDVFADGCEVGIQQQQSVTTAYPNSEIAFPIPASFIDVQTDITLNASPGDPAGFDSVTSITLASVPEPSNVLLSGMGFCLLSALMFFTRKLRARKAQA
jgi:hypothetical protein